MKKLVLAAACLMVLGFAGFGLSQSDPGQQGYQGNYQGQYGDYPMMKKQMMRHGSRGAGMGKGMMGPIGPGHPDYENYKKFKAEAAPTIEELNAKRAELRAIYRSSNPDAKRAGQLAKEITKLKEKLGEIAFKYNLPIPCPMMGVGKGMMRGGYR